MTTTFIWTGVGSRETPKAVLDLMTRLGDALTRAGGWGRSGGATGADTAFEEGVFHATPDDRTPPFTAYLPWKGFNHHPNIPPYRVPVWGEATHKDAVELVKTHHDFHHRLTPGMWHMHLRNTCQVLGENLTAPTDFLIGYAPLSRKGEPKGGTATAIKIALSHHVPVLNLYRKKDRQIAEDLLVALERSNYTLERIPTHIRDALDTK